MKQILLPKLSRRALLASGASTFVLAGCGGLLGPGDAPHLYILKPDASVSAGPKVSWALAVAEPLPSENVDSERIALIQNDLSLDYFADSAWAGRLPALVQSAMIGAFQASGRIAAVARDAEAVHANYLLQTELRDLEARYTQRDGIPTAHVRIEARLIDARHRRTVASLSAEQETPAAQNAVDAVVTAFDTAFGAVLSKIVDWALNAPPPKDD